jgi:glycosyltransferase involved in cell wall biosynthesis
VTSFAFLVPGRIAETTGDHIYARHLVGGLRARGHDVVLHELPGRFPNADDEARRACGRALANVRDGEAAIVDGIALAGCRDCFTREGLRLQPLVVFHHPLPDETGIDAAAAESFRALEARLLPLACGIICPSRRTADAVAAYGVARTRIAVVLPGTIKPPSLPPRGPRHDGPLRLLSVATVTPRKGHALLIEALARGGRPPWRLTVIGSLARDAASVAAVRAAIARHGFADRVELAGEWPQDRLAAAYGEADLFVLPSYHEGYGMAFAEALAHGLPIIATTGGAIPETVPDDAGILVPPGDVAALAGALARVMGDPGLRQKLAAGAAAAGRLLPSWDEAVARWIAAAGSLLALPRPEGL